ncbi:MAG: class I SAM-dependent RNA methyltransferase [Anaerolineaceae bacterium]|nr:class I SAM-dependent RNA methyltransferase [Anaerolineaceae bacterium]
MEHIIKISSLVYEGFGLGRLPDGKAVFIPYVLPGETVRIRIREEKKRFAFGELIEIIEKNENRISPRCKHFGQCGGCHYQHIPYELQLRYKQEIFIEQMRRMGGIEKVFVEKTIPSSQEWHYRNTLQFHLTPNGELAFMDTVQAHPFKVEECFLPMAEISKIWPLLAFEKENGITRIEIRQNETDDILLKLRGNQASIPDIEITSSISVVHTNFNDQVVIAGNEFLILSLLDKAFRVSAGSFFQTSFVGAEVLVDTVREMAEGLNGTLMDLYCGVGLFSSFLADSFDQIIGIEVSKSACSDFAFNLDRYEHISLYEETVERALPAINISPDCVVLDPPRKGMNRFALDALVEKKAPVLIYISCNPSTLARDVKRLMRSGYLLERSVLVDMFPQTYHIESVNYLTLK